jgi:hypothetical protein
MGEKNFSIFCILMSDVYAKAFNEPISKLKRGKAQTLSWLIFEVTGELLSYKTLHNYVLAALDTVPGKINPTDMTLSILVQFVNGEVRQVKNNLAWYRYRSRMLGRIEAREG